MASSTVATYSEEQENGLSIRQRLYTNLFTRALDKLQSELNVTELQKKYRAYKQQVLRIAVRDINMLPWYIQVHAKCVECERSPRPDHIEIAIKRYIAEYGKEPEEPFCPYCGGTLESGIRRSNQYDGKPDAWVEFRTLDGLLRILDGSITLDDVFAWDGCVVDSKGRMIKEVIYEGDWLHGSIMLKEILEQYLEIIRRVLEEEMVISGYAIRAYAKIKKFLSLGSGYDDFPRKGTKRISRSKKIKVAEA